jgi:hypothetical protein
MTRSPSPPAAARSPAGRGQASLELLAALPLLLGAALLAWQLVAVLGAAGVAQERARARALVAVGPPGGVVTVTAEAPVPSLLPGVEGLTVHARAAIRAP